MKQLVFSRRVQQGVSFLKKRPFWRLSLILGLFLIFAATAAAGQETKTPYLIVDKYHPDKPTRYVSSWRLNVRYGPNTGYSVITKLKHDEPFTVVGQTANGHWLFIETAAKQQGWVWWEYTTPLPPTAPKGPQVFSLSETKTETYQGQVTSFKLNLREGPSTDYKTLLKLDHQEKMAVLGRNEAGTWLYVQAANGQKGWVWSEYVHLRNGN